MTPRERWSAAVEQQHRTVAVLDSLWFGENDDQRFCDLVNEATLELDQAWRALDAISDRPSDEEFRAAYSLHRDAMLRRQRRVIARNARIAVEQRRLGAVALLARVPELAP